jgi:hypothetical protein
MKIYDKTPGYDGTIDPRSFHVRNSPDMSEAARNRVKATYKAKVTFMDKWLGMFLDTLEETGLDKNTAVLLTADHGTNVGDRNGSFGKAGPPRENESHVPFVVYTPEAGSGESNMIVQPQDIFATFMAIAGDVKWTPEGTESNDILSAVRHGNNGNRKLALGGTPPSSWSRMGPDKVIFSAFDGDWRLGFSANPEKCELQRLGSQEDVAEDNPETVRKLHELSIAEMECRHLDPALVKWLKSYGEDKFPESFHVTDANPAPKGWRGGYWNNMYRSLGIKS